MIINLGDAPFKAFITVTYPNGTCTVSLGGKSFTHSGGGTHTFTVNKKGTWTVKATNSRGVSEIANVSITYRGQVSSVTLKCPLYIYKDGDVSSLTGGWTSGWRNSISNSGSYINIAINNEGGGHSLTSNNAIDFSGYTKIGFSVTNASFVNNAATDAYPYLTITAAGASMKFTKNTGFNNGIYYISLGTSKAGVVKFEGDSAHTGSVVRGKINGRVTQMWAE